MATNAHSLARKHPTRGGRNTASRRAATARRLTGLPMTATNAEVQAELDARFDAWFDADQAERGVEPAPRRADVIELISDEEARAVAGR